MTQGAYNIDIAAIERDGYTIIEDLVSVERIAALETTLEEFAVAELERRGLQRTRRDSLHDLLLSDERYREDLFPMLKYLKIVQLISAELGNVLLEQGFLEAFGYKTPMIWPTLRVDPPNESKYLLPMHQDIVSTKCTRALRLWIPFRDANRRNGTVRVIPGTHRQGIISHAANDTVFGRTVDERHYDGMAEYFVELKAGDGLLFNPLLIHGSVEGNGDLLKYVMTVQIQDLSTLKETYSQDKPDKFQC